MNGGPVMVQHVEDPMQTVSARIADHITVLQRQQEHVILAVVGGRSAKAVFEYLQKDDIRWRHVHIMMADERLVPVDHPQSNFCIVAQYLANPLIKSGKLPADHVHPFVLRTDSEKKAVSEYDAILKRLGGVFDIIFLSAGEDGHVAGLFPEHHSIQNRSKGFFAMHDAPKEPPHRMTASVRLIRSSGRAVLIFSGAEKRQALQRFQDPNLLLHSCPAKIIQDIPIADVYADMYADAHATT